jgi:toxin ParE1/3/4
MTRVLRTPLARRDLKEIGAYLARESRSRDVATRFLDRISKKCDVYATQPELGAACPDLGAEVRRFSVGNYVVFFRPLPDGIELLRILHGGRDVPSVWRSG